MHYFPYGPLASALPLLILVGCGGGRNVAAPVEELSGRPSARAPVVVASTTTHRVRAGETLYSIAFLHGLDFQRVARWNGIRAPYLIRAGQRLRLAPPAKPVAAKVTKPAPGKGPGPALPAPRKKPATKPASPPHRPR